MNIVMSKGNLFDATISDNDYYAHCISFDCAMGAGIAEEFDKRFKLREALVGKRFACPDCIEVNHVFNLITKMIYFGKPNIATLGMALDQMKRQVIRLGVEDVYMPKIGCGTDKLKWDDVRNTLINTFDDIDITFHVYYL